MPTKVDLTVRLANLLNVNSLAPSHPINDLYLRRGSGMPRERIGTKEAHDTSAGNCNDLRQSSNYFRRLFSSGARTKLRCWIRRYAHAATLATFHAGRPTGYHRVFQHSHGPVPGREARRCHCAQPGSPRKSVWRLPSDDAATQCGVRELGCE